VRRSIFGALLVAAGSPILAEDAANPVSAFLKAADDGDSAKMTAAMDPKNGVTAKKLLKTIEGCYLRRVYQSDQDGILATWMCADGDKKSRVVIAGVSRSAVGAVVEIQMEQKNNRPAPARTGSAFSDEGH
jgi:hypothetical protein